MGRWVVMLHWTVWTVAFLTATLMSLGQSVTYVPLDQGPDSWWSRQFPGLTDASVCPELDPPGNGSVVVVGHIATYSCEANFSLVDLMGDQRPCVQGEWIGPEPSCKRDGGWSEWSGWSECSLSCDGGSRNRHRECVNPTPERPGGKECTGNTTETEGCNTSPCPECKAIQKTITVGILTISLDATGTLIQFSCPTSPLYRVEGNSTQPCDKNTELKAVTATCVRACPQLDNPANGSVTYIDLDIARYACDIGFNIRGSRERVCQDGLWSGSDAECFQELITEGKVEPVGANPSIGLGVGVFDIDSPNIPISRCHGSVTFNLRTTTTQKFLNLTVLLRVTKSDDEQGYRVVGETTDTVASKDYSSEDPRSACVTVVCPHDVVTNMTLPTVGRARITVTVADGTAEISNVNFADGIACDDKLDERILGRCNSSEDSGDCGYRNTGCGTTGWALTVNVTDDSEEDDGKPLVTLLTNRTAGSCDYYLCIPCLRQSGFAVSARGSSSDSNQAAAAKKRKKRASVSFSSTHQGNTAFCLPCTATSGLAFDEVMTLRVKKHAHNEYMSFQYKMARHGIHQLVVYAQCTNPVMTVQLAADRTPYSIDNFKTDGKADMKCLNLHKNIDIRTVKKCKVFEIKVQGSCLGSKLCFSHVDVHHKRNDCNHGRVDND